VGEGLGKGKFDFELDGIPIAPSRQPASGEDPSKASQSRRADPRGSLPGPGFARLRRAWCRTGYGQNVALNPFDRLNSAPNAATSRNQNWKFQVEPGVICEAFELVSVKSSGSSS
jgi:hypothetical protein